MTIATKLWAIGGAAFVGVPVVRAVARKVQERRREKTYKDVLVAALSNGERSTEECERVAKDTAYGKRD